MAGAAIRIAVLANAARAKAELASLEGSAAKIGNKFAKFRAPAAAALGVIGVGSFKAIQAASDLNETISKSDQIFGKNAGAMQQWADGADKNMGLSKAKALEAASGFGDMFTQIGFAGDEAAKMSKGVVQMSADLGSFNNLPTADVADKIGAAFRGEYDSLQALIPNINAARVEQEALGMTGKKSAKDLTAAEKASAVLAIVNKDGARAAGDFARTQDGAANKTKIAQAQAANLAASLGQQLLPAYTFVLQKASEFLGFLGQNQGAVTVAVVAVGLLAGGLLAASAATTVYNGAMAVAKIATGVATAAQWAFNAAMTANPIGLIVVAIGLLVGAFILAYQKSETFRNIVNGALNAVKNVAITVWNAIKTAAVAVWNFIKGVAVGAFNGIKTGLNALKNAAVAVWNGIKNGASRVWSAIKSAASAAFRFVANIIRTQIRIATNIINGIRTVASRVFNFHKSVATSAWNAIRSAISRVVSAIKGKFNEIRSKASEILGRIKSLFSANALYNAGVQLISGLARGVAARISSVVQKVRDAVQKIKDMLPGSPIKEGPLRSWNNGGAGKRLMGMLASGIRQGAVGVQREMDSVLSNIANPEIRPSFAGIGGMDMSGLGYGHTYQQITVEVKVDRTMAPAEVGREITTALNAYKKAGGR